MRNLYELLGVHEKASHDEIVAALLCRTQEEQQKQDQGDKEAEINLFNLHEAKRVLLIGNKRELYDSGLKGSNSTSQVGAGPSVSTGTLIECKVCMRPISKNANSCPHCGEPQTPKINSPWEMVAGLVLFAAIFGGIYLWQHREPPTLREKLEEMAKEAKANPKPERLKPVAQPRPPERLKSLDEMKLDIEAFIECKSFVKNKLKAPTTAKFPFSDYNAVNQGNGRYTIFSYVDSQNSFGAMLQTKYACQLHAVRAPDSNLVSWVLESIVFDKPH